MPRASSTIAMAYVSPIVTSPYSPTRKSRAMAIGMKRFARAVAVGLMPRPHVHPSRPRFVHEIEDQHHRRAERGKLTGQDERAPEIAGVRNLHDEVGLPVLDHTRATRNGCARTVRRSGSRAGACAT